MKKHFLLLAALATVAVACKDDDPVEDPHDDHEEELITTVKLTFTDSATSTSTVYMFQDLDGDGGNVPTIDTLFLDSSATYYVNAEFLNESESPAEDITPEIIAEDTDHLVCYSTSSNVGIEVTDYDANNLELGLESTWSTMSAETGSVMLSLKHQPGIKDGSCSVGETDVEVDFPLVVQ